MNKNACVFCDSEKVTSVGNVSANEIISAYKITLNASVEHLFTDSPDLIELLHCENCDLKWYQPMVAGDAKFYEQLQQHDWYYQDHKPEYDFAKNQVRQGDNVLEIGCGKGTFGRLIGQKANYSGLEFNHTAVEKANAAGLNVVIDTVENHANKNQGVYDVVCHFQVLEHVLNPHQFLEACVKALKPGGKLMVAVPSDDSFMSVAESIWLNMPPHHLSRWSDRALEYALGEFGLKEVIVWHEPLADYHKNLYRSVMLNMGIKQLFGVHPSLVKDSIFSGIAGKLERFATIGDWFSNRGAKQFKYAERGHTVCIVGTKVSS